MLRVNLLSEQELDAALLNLPQWARVSGRSAIAREFEFADFNQAFAFMTRVAMQAEKLDHHPEWRNVYRRVSVVLTTHDVAGVSELDLRLARFCDLAASAA